MMDDEQKRRELVHEIELVEGTLREQAPEVREASVHLKKRLDRLIDQMMELDVRYVRPDFG